MTPPNIPAVAVITIAGALISLGTLAHVSTHLNAAAHHVAHKEAIAKAQFKCPDGVRQSHQKPNGELICVFDLRNGYGLARRRVNGAK